MAIQVLPQANNFGSQLAQAIAGATTNIGQGVLKGYERSKDQRILENLPNSTSALDLIQKFGALSQEGQKAISPLFQQLVHGQAQAATQQSKFEQQKELAQYKEGLKKETKQEPYEYAKELVEKQRNLLKTGDIGGKFQILGTGRDWGSTRSGKGIKNRAEYERLGKSYIGIASTIPIRNRLEFEKLSDKLYDPTLSREELEGTLDAMERFINTHLQGKEGESKEGVSEGKIYINPQTKQKIKFINGKWSEVE